jgi:hypothetical protein
MGVDKPTPLISGVFSNTANNMLHVVKLADTCACFRRRLMEWEKFYQGFAQNLIFSCLPHAKNSSYKISQFQEKSAYMKYHISLEMPIISRMTYCAICQW